VRYRIKSWKKLPWCIEDCRAALSLAADDGAEELALLGFSMGGAVAIAAADHPRVTTVIGLAPWIPDRLDVSTLDGRRLAIVHGALDRWLPGIPGVSPKSSLRGFERIRQREIDATHTIVSGGLHGLAIRSRHGGTVPLPRARHWAKLVAAELRRFESG
jgi:dienelactone hydrolase